MERKIKMKATSRSIKILNRSVRGHSKELVLVWWGGRKTRTPAPGKPTPAAPPRGRPSPPGNAPPRSQAVRPGGPSAGWGGRMPRRWPRRAKSARAPRAVGRRGPRIPTAACRDVGAASVHSDGRREALAPSGAPRLARGDRGGGPRFPKWEGGGEGGGLRHRARKGPRRRPGEALRLQAGRPRRAPGVGPLRADGGGLGPRGGGGPLVPRRRSLSGSW